MQRFMIAIPVIAYVYIWYLSITLFLIPAFKLYFSLYGIFGTFGIWAGLTIAGYFCGYYFMKLLTLRKETRHELS